MRSIYDSVSNQAYNFRLCTEGRGNFIVCARKVLELNEKIFTFVIEQKDGIESECIYQKEFDDIEDNLEAFRVEMYIGAKKEKIKHYPVVGRIISFDEEEK